MFLFIKSKQTETTLQAQLSCWLPRASLFISLPLITPWSHLPLSQGPFANAPQQISSYFQLLYDDGSKTCFCHSFKWNLKINNWEADLRFHLLAPLTWVFLPLKIFWIHSPCSESHQEVKILIVTYKLNSKTWLHYSGDKRARDYWHFHLILIHGASWDWYNTSTCECRKLFFICFYLLWALLVPFHA